eukprot:10061179-Ditylum_brightwellii.AAC.1
MLHPPSKGSNGKALNFPRPIHRLDRRTSGLVLVAKTELAMSKLSQCFSKRMVKKSYIALAFREAFNNDDEKFQTSMNNMIDEDDSSQQIDDYINKTSSSSMGTIQSKSDDIQGEE